jgi:hypothetical protein
VGARLHHDVGQTDEPRRCAGSALAIHSQFPRIDNSA